MSNDSYEGIAAELETILKEHCGASDTAFGGFRHSLARYGADSRFPFEWRFIGVLGFGGKIHHNGPGGFRVSCYSEDRTPERQAMMANATAAISEVLLNDRMTALMHTEVADA